MLVFVDICREIPFLGLHERLDRVRDFFLKIVLHAQVFGGIFDETHTSTRHADRGCVT